MISSCNEKNVLRKTGDGALFRCSATLLFLLSLILLFCLLGNRYTEQVDSLKTIYTDYVFLAFFTYLVIFLTSPKKVCGKINVYLIFMALTIPFYWGGQLLVFFGFWDKLSQERYSLVDGRIENQYIVSAMQYVLICLLMIHVGYLIAYHFWNKKKRPLNDYRPSISQNSQAELFRKRLLAVSLVIIGASIIPTFARLIYDMRMANSLGHLASYNLRSEEDYLGIWYVFSFILGWFLPSCYLALMTSKNKSVRVTIYVLIAAYALLYLLCGSRYHIVEIVVSVFLIEFCCRNRRIKIRTIVLSLLFLVVLLIVLRSVSYVRDKTGSGLSLESIGRVISEGLFYEVLFETSTTFTSIASIIKNCPSYLDYNYGASVLGSIYYIFPAFLRPTNGITLHISAVLSPLYYGYKGAGYGSAFLTEAYFNYSYFAYFFMVIFGVLLFHVCHSVHLFDFRRKKSIILGCFGVFLFSKLTWGIRSDLYLLPRHFVYYVLIPIIISSYPFARNHYEQNFSSINLLQRK